MPSTARSAVCHLASTSVAASCVLNPDINVQVGAYEDKPAKIAEVVRGWVHEQKEEFNGMALRAKQMGQPHAVFRIVEDLAAMCA